MGGPGIVDGYCCVVSDNFYECKFVVDGVEYKHSEGYFQSCKTHNQQQKQIIRACQGGEQSWYAGTKATLRPDWEKIKVECMYQGNKAKFQQNPDFADQLIKTKGKFDFGVGFWGKWNAIIMQRIRAQLRNSQEDKLEAAQLKKQMDQYASEH